MFSKVGIIVSNIQDQISNMYVWQAYMFHLAQDLKNKKLLKYEVTNKKETTDRGAWQWQNLGMW